MVDVSTTNVIVSRSGTGFTIDVTPCNLDADLTVIDFIVIQGGVLSSVSNYQKTSRTILTYIGVSLPVTAIEIRRKTPVNVIQTITYASRFNSALWNAELERNARWKAETELNGSGVSGVGIPIPDNGIYSATWGSDVIYPPTRQAVYNKIETLAPLASPALTGSPTVPNIGSIISNSTIPNTKYVGDNYAPLVSPSLTGNPTAPTKAFGDSSVSIATDAFVQAAVTPFRASGAVAARAAGLSGAGYVDVVTIPVTLPRVNPVSCRFFIYPGAGGWSANNTATTAVLGGWVFRVNGLVVAEQSFPVSSSSTIAIPTPNGTAYVLTYALPTSSINVVLQTRYSVSTTQNWNAFTFWVEFYYA